MWNSCGIPELSVFGAGTRLCLHHRLPIPLTPPWPVNPDRSHDGGGLPSQHRVTPGGVPPPHHPPPPATTNSVPTGHT